MKIVFQCIVRITDLCWDDEDCRYFYDTFEYQVGVPKATLEGAKIGFTIDFKTWLRHQHFRDAKVEALFIRPILEGAVDTPMGLRIVRDLGAG